MDNGKLNIDEIKYEAMKQIAGTAHNIRCLYVNITNPIPQIVRMGGAKKDTIISSTVDREPDTG